MNSDWGILMRQELGVSPSAGRVDAKSPRDTSAGSKGFDLKLRPRARFEPARPSGNLEAIASDAQPQRSGTHLVEPEAQPRHSEDGAARKPPGKSSADRADLRLASHPLDARATTREAAGYDANSQARESTRVAPSAATTHGSDGSPDTGDAAHDLATLALVAVTPPREPPIAPGEAPRQTPPGSITNLAAYSPGNTQPGRARSFPEPLGRDRDAAPRHAPSPAAELGIAIDAATGPRGGSSAPRVHVTIGSIELRLEGPRTSGTSRPPAPPPARTAPRPRAATTSLQDYLHGTPPGAVRP
jgi:hypothetical protein